MPDVPPRQPRPLRLLRDTGARVVAVAVLAAVAAVFLTGAWAGTKMIGRLGGLGLGMYVLALVAWGLLFVPLVAYAIGLLQRGSKRYRDALAERQRIEHLRYGLGGVEPDEPR